MKSKIIDGVIYSVDENGAFYAKYSLGGTLIFRYGKAIIPEKLQHIYKQILES